MSSRVQDNPAPLVVAASLVAVEGALLVLFAIVEVASLSQERLAMGVTTALFFVLYGAALVFFAWQLTRRRPWARGPVLFAQLIQLGVAWNFRGGDTTWISIGLAVVAVVVLAGMLHPQSLTALNDEQ